MPVLVDRERADEVLAATYLSLKARQARAVERPRLSLTDLASTLSGGRWTLAPHLSRLAGWLTQAAEGNRPRIVVAMPPRHGKSELVSHWFPVWYLNRWPDRRVILASYEADFAASWGRRVRNTITQQADRLSVRVAGDSAAANRWDTTEGGGMVTAGVGGPITGRGADLLIIDDPVKNAEEAGSQTYRQRAWEWWTSTAYTRLEPGGIAVLVQTRWHRDDLAGRILSESAAGGESWDELNLPALAGDDDALNRASGQPLWPARYDLDALGGIRRAVGDRVWQALYQQDPRPPEGAIWKREYWRTYASAPPASMIVQAWDTAFQDTSGADYSACVTWAVSDQGFYLLDVTRKRLAFPQLVQASRALFDRYQPNVLLVEDHASGQSLVQVLRQDTRLPVVARKMDKSKENRAWGVVGMAESRRLFVPERAPWLDEYLSEMEDFPHGKHDDQVDATTLALGYLRPFAGDHLTAGSDADARREQEAEQHGHDSRPTLDFGRGSDLSPYSPSRWGGIRGRR